MIKTHTTVEDTKQRILYACAIGISLALTLAIAPHVDALYYASITYTTIMGGACVAACISKPNTHSAALLLGGSLAFAYGFGTVNTEIRFIASEIDLIKLNYIIRTELSEATALVLLTTSLMCALGCRINAPLLRAETFDKISTQAAIKLGFAALCFCVALLATGEIRFNAGIADDFGSASKLGQISLAMIAPAAGLIAAKFAAFSRRERIIAIAVLSLLLCTQLLMGRRVLLFTAITCLICYFSTSGHTKLFTKRNIFIAVILVPCLLAASRGFMAMRLAKSELPENTSIVAILSEAAEILNQPERTGINEITSDNEKTRTFIIGYLAETLKLHKVHGPLYGDLTKFAVAIVTPSAFWPGKTKYVSLGFEETISHTHYGIPIWDGANTLLTTGLADFGLAGAILLPIFIALIFSYAPIALATITKRPEYLVPLAIGSLYTMLSVEAALSGYLVSLRDLLLICAAFALALKLQRLASKPPQ